MSTKNKFPLHVIYHGAKAHRIIGMQAGDLVAACGLRLPQTRPALSRDKICKVCTKELRKIGRQKSQERTCVHCGCTDSRACAGGCLWVIKHKKSPTGICSACCGLKIIIGGFILQRDSRDHTWMFNRIGEGMRFKETTEARLRELLKTFFDSEF